MQGFISDVLQKRALLLALSLLLFFRSLHGHNRSPNDKSFDALVTGFFISGPSNIIQFSSVQLLSSVRLFAIPWTAARQASLSITNSRSLLKLKFTESVMPSNHLIFCCPLLLLPSIFPSIRIFSNESALHIRWPKYWSFSFKSVLPVNTQD